MFGLIGRRLALASTETVADGFCPKAANDKKAAVTRVWRIKDFLLAMLRCSRSKGSPEFCVEFLLRRITISRLIWKLHELVAQADSLRISSFSSIVRRRLSACAWRLAICPNPSSFHF